MSGIAIDIADDGASTERAVDIMMECMAHRGPDGARRFSTHTGSLAATIGQLSLWTTPEDEGVVEPIVDARRRVIAFAGRLDDREELAASLGVAPSVSDRALALAAFERWGDAAPTRLLGDFAFVIWSPRDAQLFACRDRLGAVPLFFHAHAHGVRLASEKRALAFDARLAPRPDLEALTLALVDEHSEREETLLAGVQAIAPGHRFTWSPRGHRSEPYWKLDLDRRVLFRDESDYARDLRETLTIATRDRLRARGTVAIAVSGGLDSSAVAAIAVREAQRSSKPIPKLATVRYPGLACDEGWFSERLARHLEVPLVEVTMSREAAALGPRDRGDLLYDPTIAGYEDMARAAGGARVFLTGWGSDELQWWTGFEAEHAVRHLAIGDALRWSGVFERPLAPSSWRALLGAAARGSGARRRRGLAGANDAVPAWLTPLARELLRQGRARREERLAWLHDRSPVEQAIAAGLTDGLQAPFGVWHVGMQGAALGIEMRHPFFDVRVVERLLAYPLHVRCDHELLKPLLRRAMDPLLPPSLAWRTLRPSFMPFFELAATLHGAETTRILEGHRLQTLGLVRGGDAAPRAEGDIRQLGTLLTLEAWLATTCRL